MYTMSPPLRGSCLVATTTPRRMRTAQPPWSALLRLSRHRTFTPTPPATGQS